MLRRSIPNLLIALPLAAMLAAQAGWAAVGTSGTPDETTYLTAGAAMLRRGDATPLATDGIAPLPPLLTTALPVAAGALDDYARAVRLARASAILLFAVPLVLLVYAWLSRLAGGIAAAAGAAVVAFSPNIVGHAAVAATDICFVTAALLALFALARFAECRSSRRFAWLAVALGGAFGAKYSAVALMPAVFAVLAATHSSGSLVKRCAVALALAVALVVAALCLVWALHGFSAPSASVAGLPTRRAPAVIVGLLSQALHQRGGHPAFLLGLRSPTGWWYYMPVALFFKSTPVELILFALALAAFVTGWNGGPDVLVWRAAILSFGAFALVNRLDLGVRYVLLFVPLCVCVALERWRRAMDSRLFAGLCAVLVAAQLTSAGAIAPHYLSYFNRLSGGPARGYQLLADSNVDWGQDLPALRDEMTRLGGGALLLSYFGNAPLDAYGVVAKRWDANDQRNLNEFRWVAISATHLDGLFVADDLFAPFRLIAPSSRAAYSILVYSTDRPEVREAMAEVARRWRSGAP